MPLTSEDVHNQSFSIARKGYNVDEVDVFLEKVSDELKRLNDVNAQLNDELKAARRANSAAASSETGVLPVSGTPGITQQDLDERDSKIQQLQGQLDEKKKDDSAIAQALIIAQRSADEIIATANQNADTTRQDAEAEGQRILDKANAEKQRILDEITKLEDDREAAREGYADMLTDFIASSQDILSDLKGQKAKAPKSHLLSSGAPSSSNFSSRAPMSSPTPHLNNGANGSASNDVPSTANHQSAATAAYTTPTINHNVVKPATPTPSKVEKDFSGFGDPDVGFNVDDVD